MKSVAAFLSAILLTACAGEGPTTTTDRAIQEQLLVSTTTERTLDGADFSGFAGRRVFVEARAVTAQVRDYARSAVRQRLSRAGALLPRARAEAEVVIELRSAAVGDDYGDWLFFVPVFVAAGQGPVPEDAPEWLELGYSRRDGWAAVRGFGYVVGTGARVDDFSGWSRLAVDDTFPEASVLESLKERVE
ncbi:MAG: DUF6655 family protein [Planctomycetota bacterium]